MSDSATLVFRSSTVPQLGSSLCPLRCWILALSSSGVTYPGRGGGKIAPAGRSWVHLSGLIHILLGFAFCLGSFASSATSVPWPNPCEAKKHNSGKQLFFYMSYRFFLSVILPHATQAIGCWHVNMNDVHRLVFGNLMHSHGLLVFETFLALWASPIYANWWCTNFYSYWTQRLLLELLEVFKIILCSLHENRCLNNCLDSNFPYFLCGCFGFG